jgi:hypothetical protein
MKNGLNIDEDGTKRWYLNSKRHREDGPAIEIKNSRKEWWINGPAIEYTDGYKEWFLNDQLVYSKDSYNNLHKYDNLSEEFKMSIIKYKLST